MRIKKHYLPNVVFIDIPTESRIWPATKNYVPGQIVYGERLYTDPKTKIEYRTWDPFRSKLASCISVNMPSIPENLNESRILYLGAATGTTVSHLSDIVADSKGVIYAVEFSVRPARKLIQLSQQRKNIVPIVVDARFPERYFAQVWFADFIFQDISQINQAQIFIDNVDVFLRPKGKGILIIKIKSIDTVAPEEEVVSDQLTILEKHGLKILEIKDISTFEKAHRAVLVEKP